MALVKNPKAALARSRAATLKTRSAARPKQAKVVPADGLKGLAGATADMGALRKTNVGAVKVSPHGLVGSIPLGHRSPRYNEPIQVLQASEDFCGSFDAEKFVARMLIEEFRQRHAKRDERDEWIAWIGTVAYQPAGLIFWIGLSSNVPAAVLGSLDELIRAMGFVTARGTAIPDEHGLEPLLYLGDEGLELLRMI